MRDGERGPTQPPARGRVPREALIGVALVALAAALRAARWSATAAMFNDGPAFLGIAQAMAAGEWGRALAHDYHPLYAFATLLAHLLAGAPPARDSWEDAAAAVSIVAGAASVGLLYALLRRLFDPGVAALGALILAVHPTAVQHSADVQSDGLYLACFLAAVLCTERALAGRRAALAAWAGALAGLAYLVRPEGLGAVLVAGGLGGLRLLQRRWSAGEAAGWGAALAAGALLVMTPYLVAVRVDTGAWQLTKKKSVARLAGVGAGYYPPEDAEAPAPAPAGAATSAAAASGAARAVWPRPLRAAGELLKESIASIRYEVLFFLAIGLFVRRGRPGDPGVFVLAHVLLYTLVLYQLALNAGYVSKRHVLPPATLGFGYAALGIPAFGAALIGAARRALPRRPANPPRASERALATALGLALLLPLALGKNLRGQRDDSGAERRAAEWLRAQPGDTGPVAADKARVAWYAEAPFVSLREAGSAPLVPWLQGRGTRYLITDTAALSKRPALAAAAKELPLMHEAEYEGALAQVYAVPDAGASMAPPGSPR